MRQLVPTLACALALSLAAPAGAQYWSTVANQAGVGLNGILTAPADPVMSVVQPPKQMIDAPGGRFLGLFTGTLLSGYRIGMGVFDILLAPLPSLMMSPVPRFKLIPGIVHDDE